VILGLAHVGIRVHDLERSRRFYGLLGFRHITGPVGPEPVAILEHPSGLELNLILNAPEASVPNILMDVPEKHPGITHLALLCPDLERARAELEAAGVAISGGPVQLENLGAAIFARAPHPTVIALHRRLK
jgi:lactoylglutathione lyase